jgi:alpha-mannosidase
LRDIEYFATLATTLPRPEKSAYRYPKVALDDLWEHVLLCQFHDVLPGSAIAMVYDDVEKVSDSLVSQNILPVSYQTTVTRYTNVSC